MNVIDQNDFKLSTRKPSHGHHMREQHNIFMYQNSNKNVQLSLYAHTCIQYRITEDIGLFLFIFWSLEKICKAFFFFFFFFSCYSVSNVLVIKACTRK